MPAAHLKIEGAGFLYFDVVLSESAELSSEITSSPVEKGANISDHVREQLDRVVLEVFVSNHPIIPEDLQDAGSRGGSVNGVPLDVPKYSPPINSPGALYGAALGAVEGAVKGLLGVGADPNVATVLKFSKSFDAGEECLKVLQKARTGKKLVTVHTNARDYESMIVEKIGVRRDESTGAGTTFTISLVQIRFVSLELVNAPLPSFPRAAKKKDRGKQDTKPTETKKKSLLKGLVGGGF